MRPEGGQDRPPREQSKCLRGDLKSSKAGPGTLGATHETPRSSPEIPINFQEPKGAKNHAYLNKNHDIVRHRSIGLRVGGMRPKTARIMCS